MIEALKNTLHKETAFMKHSMDKYFDNLVQSTVEILRFYSSLKPAEGENGKYPFGKETADCLQYFLNLAKSFGFASKNYDNYIGEVVWGTGKDFAICSTRSGNAPPPMMICDTPLIICSACSSANISANWWGVIANRV